MYKILLLLVPLLALGGPKTFRVRLAEDMASLDWNYGEVNPEISYQLMEGLFRADKNGKAEPAAVSRYRWNKNQTELELHLHRDRKWSDGAPLCAQQFVDSWNRLRSKEFASLYAHYANAFRSFEARNCHELTIRFSRPAPEALALLSHYVFFPLRLDNLKRRPNVFSQGVGLIVNGPFQPVEWKLNQSLLLERNPFFAGPRSGSVERIEFLFVPEDSTAKVMFEQGKLDWMRDVGQLLRTPTMEKSAEFRVYPADVAFYFGLNAEKSELLKNELVRRALSLALDRRELPKVLGREFQGTSTWLRRRIYPGLKDPAPPKDEKNILSLARDILERATKEGKMNLSLRVYQKSSHRLLAEWAQGQWEKKLGVRIPVEVKEAKVYWKELASSPPPIFLGGVTAPYAHPRALLQEFLSSSTANWTGWSSGAYDAAVADGRYQEAEEELGRAGFIIPIYYRDSVALLKKGWRNFFVNPLGQAFLSEVR